MATVYPIPPGLWCVPSALVAITGLPFDAVIHPALNRHSLRQDSLLGMVTGASIHATLATLRELGYTCRAYRADDRKAHVVTWATRSFEKYPGRTLLLLTASHALVAADGRVWDNHMPHGPIGSRHPYARTQVTNAYLVEKAR